MTAPGVAALWRHHRILVCLGSGGVGKTTVAAALAVAAARDGKRTLVMTIDPARRLAQALGLPDIGNQPQPVPISRLALPGAPPPATLEVVMPDVRGTFDGLVRRWAPSPQAADYLMNNRVYQHFASALAGSHEYAAVEALCAAVQRDAYDLIVVDTPPAQNAMAFLRAPDRVVDFLGTDAVRWLLRPSGFAGKLLGWGGNVVLRGIGKVAGDETLRALGDFVKGFDSMSEGFLARAVQVKKLFAEPTLGFVLVTSADVHQPAVARHFLEELESLQLAVRAAFCNRLRPTVPECDDGWLAALEPPVAQALAAALAEERALGEADAAAAAGLQKSLPGITIHRLPEALGGVMELAQAMRL